MDGNPAQQAFKELLPYLEALETQSAAILQLLKDKGLTTDEQFAPYLEQAGNVTNVKWLAARLRIEHLLTSIDKDKDKDKKEGAEKTAANGNDQSDRMGREAGDAGTAVTKQDAEGKDNAKQENTPASQSAKPVDGRKEDRKEAGSNANEDRDAQRNSEKKAS